MTDLEQLERLANAAGGERWIRLFGERTVFTRSPHDGCRERKVASVDRGFSQEEAARLDFIAAANPAAILSLIQRVREAEAALSLMHGGETINAASYKQGYADGLGIADADRELFATPIAILQERVRNETLEEAAKVADSMGNTFSFSGSHELCDLERAVDEKCAEIAKTIRALKEKVE